MHHYVDIVACLNAMKFKSMIFAAQLILNVTYRISVSDNVVAVRLLHTYSPLTVPYNDMKLLFLCFRRYSKFINTCKKRKLQFVLFMSVSGTL